MSNRIGPLFPLRLRNLPAARLLSGAVLAATLPLAMAACAGPRPTEEMPSSAEQGGAVEPIAPGEPHPMPAPRTCNAEAAKAALVGKTADTATVERARTQAGGHTVRVLKPGQAITKEYMDGRVNVHVDENNVIVDVGCG
ncbi:peptidase inhibitor I78 family protein [Lysobacter capsici]|uniref:I78 family peptidase inhibitor n=1 Tax=Lysobacter capsici TaxID=435897 RepID=UPI00071650BA|nr:I78 family peptidase inhibitor [Lysobacter capsici]ALN88475.1 peptidase inhibitor I78 family protein [Lysobacter capsici]